MQEEGEINEDFSPKIQKDEKKHKKDKKSKKEKKSKSKSPTKKSEKDKNKKKRSHSRSKTKKRHSRTRSRERSISKRKDRYSTDRYNDDKYNKYYDKYDDKNDKYNDKYRNRSRSRSEKKSKKDKDRKKDKKSRKSKDKRSQSQHKTTTNNVILGEFVNPEALQNKHLEEEDDIELENLQDIDLDQNMDDDQNQQKQQSAALTTAAKLLQEFEQKDDRPPSESESSDEEDENIVKNTKKIDESRLNMLKMLDRNNSAIKDNENDENNENNDDDQNSDNDSENGKNQLDMFDFDSNENIDEDKQQVFDDHNYDDDDDYLKIRIKEVIGDRYEVVKKMGKGMFASVCQAYDNVDKIDVAIKILRNQETMLQSGQREAEIFQLLNKADILNKRHIIRLLRTFEHRKHLCLVFELFNMDLRHAIRHYGKMTLDHVASYGKQLFSALVHMKKNNIIHADLKPDNILISKDTKIVKMCDFGTSFPIQDVVITDMLVSRFYRAPEIIMGYKYDYGIDVWSLACTLFEMYYGEGKFCFKGGDNNQLLKDQLQKRGKLKAYLIKRGAYSELYFDSNGNFLSNEEDPVHNKKVIKSYNFGNNPTVNFMPMPSGLSPDEVKKFTLFKDLLEKSFNMDPKKRITADKAIEHPFFNQRSQ